MILLFYIMGMSEGFGQIALRGTSSNSNNGNTLSLARPAGLQVGDLMIVNIAQSDNDSDNLDAGNFLPGWTIIYNDLFASQGNNRWWGTFLYKIADAGDVATANFVFDGDNQAESMVGGLSAFSGVDSSNPFDVIGTPNTGNADDVAANAISPTTPGNALVMLSLVGDNRTYDDGGWNTNTPGPGRLGLTEIIEETSTTSADLSAGAAWALNPNTGDTGDGDAELDGGGNDRYVSILLALRPCTVPTGTLSGQQTICLGGTTTFTSSASGGTWSSSNPSIATINPSTGVITGSSAGTATMTYTVTGSCGTSTVTRDVTVSPSSVGGTITGSTTVCSGANSTVLTLSGHVGTIIRWESSLDNFATAGTPIANTTSTLTATNLSSTTSYRAIVQSGTCTAANSSSASVTVIPASVGGTITGSATVCSGTNSTVLTLSGQIGTIIRWESSLDNFATAGTPIANTTTTLTATNLSSTTSYRAVVQRGSCALANSTSATVTVSPNKSASASSNPTVCAVTGNPNITHSTSGVTSIGAATGLPAGVTASFAGGIITVSGNPTEIGTFNYSIPLVGSCGPDAFATGTIIVENCACEDIFTSSGNFEVPVGVTSIIVETWGAGGRGSTRTSDGYGSGGGGGGYSRATLTVSPGQFYSYIVGAGGNNSSIDGGNTVFGTNLVVANGGRGASNNSSTGGSGATLGTGDVTRSGGNGANADNSGSGQRSGGGGSSGGPGGNGVDATNSNGAAAPSGGGAGGDGTNTNDTNGVPGEAPGGGGGGSRRDTGTRNGGTGGDGQIKITYTLSAGIVSGQQSICLGGTSTLSSTFTGGTWSSSNPSIATVSTSGVVTGVAVGVATIRYTIIGSCAIATSTRTVFINQPINPGTLSGVQEVCIGDTSQFSSTSSNGTWSSDNTSVATVSSTGLVTGLAAGTTTIRYTLPASGGCPSPVATRTITVSTPPVAGTLSGIQDVCVGGNSTFSSTSAGGTWTSDNTAIASVNSTTGLITGVSAGTATLTYTVAGVGGCLDALATRTVTITAPPSAGTLSGSNELCVGDDTSLSSTSTGGTWTSDNPAIASVNSSTGVVTGVAAGTATLNYTVPGTGGCADATATRNITVYALPSPTFTTEPSSDICIGTSVTYTTQAGQFDYDWNVDGIEGTDYTITSGGIGTTSNTVTLTWLTEGTNDVTVNYSNANGCAISIPISNTINVNPLPVPTFSSPPSNPVCIGDQVTYTTQAGQSNYVWNVPGSAGTDYNITAGGIGTSSNTVTIEWLTDGSKTVTVNYQDANGCTGLSAASNTIDLDPLPVPTFTTEPSNPVCIGDQVTYTTQAGQSNYVWNVPGSAGTDYNITAGGIGTSSNTVTIEWLTDGSKTVTVNYQDANGCTGLSAASNTIDLDPLPVPTFTTEPSNPVCIGDQVTYTTQAGQSNYVWNVPGSAGTDYNITAGGIGTSSNTVTVEWLTDRSKTVTVNYQDANGCSIPSPASNTIDVSIYASIVTQPDTTNQLECLGDGFDPISITATGSNLSYQWYRKSDTTDPVSNPGTAMSGATMSTYTPPSTPEGISYYYVVVTGNCGAETSTLSGQFIVNPSGTLITDHPDVFDETVCFGGTFSQLDVAASGDGGSAVTYQWYQNDTPSNTAGISLSGEVNPTFTPPSDAGIADGLPRYYYATASSSCGTVPSDISGAFTVNPLTSIESESLAGATICEDDGPFAPISVSAIGTGTLSYQWYSNTTGVVNTGSDTQVGSNADSFTPPSNVADGSSVYYYVVVSSSGGCGPDVISNISGAFVVNPNNIVTGPSSTPTECINIAIPDITHSTTYATGIGTPTGLPNGVTANWAANVITISGTPTVSGTFNYSIPLTGGCGTVEATGTITVTPDMTSTSAQADGTTCINQALTAIEHTTTLATGIGTPTGLPTGVTANWAANVITISGTPTVSGTFNYSIPLSGGCGTVEATGTITVTPDMTVTSAQADGTTCINQALTAVEHTTTLATGIGTPTGLPNGVTANWAASVITISGTPTVSGTFNYSIPLTGGCGTVEATGTITVTPDMTVTSAQADGTTCINQTLTAIEHTTTLATGIGTPTGLPTGVTANWAADVITISGTPTVSGTFNYSIPLSGGCGNVAATGAILVNAVSVITDIVATPICSGDSFVVSPENGADGIVLSGTTYTWTVSANSNVTGESAETNPQANISQTLTNTSLVDQIVTYTVTPETPEGCSGDTFEVDVTVRPTPTVNPISSQAAVCSGEPSTAVNFSGNGVSGVVYNWTNSDPSIGLAASGSGNIPAFTTENTSSGPVTATITVTPTANGCAGPSESFTITINPSPIVTLLADYCAVAGSVELVASSNVAGTTWLWNTGETTATVLVDIAGLYSVTATSPNGCSATSSISVAEELVFNGSFTNFDPANPGFFTEYTQNQAYYVNGNGSTGLWPEGNYAVNINANGSTTTTPPGYHTSFYGRDHTNNSVGPRNFLMVNGGELIGSPLRQPIIWEQTVTVEPFTEYYFSAWAMNLNPGSPARLQFEINGVLVGTILDLDNAPKPTSSAEVGLDNWREFRSDPSWSSGSATEAVIRIVNLNTVAGGNDFALDDISFGTLSPFIRLSSPAGTDDSQVVCEDTPIIDIEYTVGGGLAGPVVEDLPPGVTSVWNGVNLRFGGSPTTPGTYNYTVFTTGSCLQVRATGTIVVRDTPTAETIASDQTVCEGQTPATITGDIYSPQEAGATISYRWELNTNLVTPNWVDVPGSPSSANYNPPVLTETTQYRRYTISTVNGLSCESPSSDPVTITLQSEPTAGGIASAQTICQGEDPAAFTSTTGGTGDGNISYRWEFTNSTNPIWTTIAGENGATYDSPALVETTQFRRVTISTLNGVGCESSPTNPVVVTVIPENTVTPVNPDPTLCFDSVIPITLIHTTSGATGISNDGVAGANGLPLGVSATFDSSSGDITISGTPSEVGDFNYSIPLTGGCGSFSATGTISVENPTYPIISIDVVNPPNGSSPPYTSTFTVFSNELTTGTYAVNYSLSGTNAGADQTISVDVTTSGEFTFESLPYTNEGTSILTINSIQKTTDLCPFNPPNNNTAPFGISCNAEYLSADGDVTYSVPADVFQVTIEVFGDGSGGNTASQTMVVQPGGQIFLVFDGTDVFATEVPDSEPVSDRLAQAIVSTTGPDGRVVITYECAPSPPCSGSGDVFQYTDPEGFTIIRFTGNCTWSAPEGLDEFEVLVVGGGGGGGFGGAAGGGGGGAVIYQQYTAITMNGSPGLQGAEFNISPGGQGLGALSISQAGVNGEASSFTGPSFGYTGANTFSDLNAPGGGGGGSSNADQNIRSGRAGASGGGGAANGNENSAGGAGSAGNSGGTANGQSFGASGAGGGGAAASGENGSDSGNGNLLVAGAGGNGVAQSITGEDIYYGAGGGGTSSGGIVNEPGTGGSPYNGSNGDQFYAGGSGSNNGIGQPATTYGSGGGAGVSGGSPGFQGVVYIRYPNFRILPIDLLYFEAEYNEGLRAGDLSWATAKEWENDRFEIQRSVNDTRTWEIIGEMKGAGYSEEVQLYDYQDTRLPIAGGNIFYRLKQYDSDGKTSYSQTRAIQVEPISGITRWRVFPNPTKGDPFHIEILDLSTYNDEPITLRVISPNGQFETFQVSDVNNMGPQVSTHFYNMASGVYTIEISWGIFREYHKVILTK